MMLRSMLLGVLLAVLCVPGWAQFGSDDLRYDVHLTGTVTELGYGTGDFVLMAGRNQGYVVIADAAVVQLNGFSSNTFTSLESLKDRALVRVFGARLSPRTIYAKTIIVLDDTGKYVDLGLQQSNWVVGDGVEFEGTVTHVSIAANDITFYTSVGNFAAVPRLDTRITRGGWRTDIYGVYPGDRIRVSGRLTASRRIDPDSIQVLGSGWFTEGPVDRFWIVRMDGILGFVVDVPCRPKWIFRVRTPLGLRNVRLAIVGPGPGGDEMGCLNDIQPGRTVQLSGVWDSRTLVANRFSVVKIEDKEKKPSSDDKKPKIEGKPSYQKPKAEQK